MPDEVNDRRRAALAAARFVIYILFLSIFTMGAALPLLALTPWRYRRMLRRARAGYYPALLRAGYAHRGGIR